MSEGCKWWCSRAFRRDAETALTRAAAILIVPAFVSLPPLPLALFVVFSPVLVLHEPVQGLRATAFVLAWYGVLSGFHYWFLRSKGWKRHSLITPIVLLTLGPLYWGLWAPWPPAPEEIAEQRKPESGSWKEVCRWEGDYTAAETAKGALDAGVAWLKRVDGLGHVTFNLASGCALIEDAVIPPGASLKSGHFLGRAVYAFDGALFGVYAGAQRELSRPDRSRSIALSDDGEWVAWTFAPDPDDDDSSHELVVQRLDGSDRWSTRLRLLPAGSRSSELLAYDPSTRETFIRLASNRLARVDAAGGILTVVERPDGCWRDHYPSWWVHPMGWAYSEFSRCDLIWNLGDQEMRLDLSPFETEAIGRWNHVRDVSISSDGSLLAFATGIHRGEGMYSSIAVLVVRAEDGAEVGRIHLDTSADEPYIAFVGPDHLLISHWRLVRLIRLNL